MSKPEDKIQRFRLGFLIKECGRRVFRNKVEKTASPLTIEYFLDDARNKETLHHLRDKDVITAEQYMLLYPDTGTPSINDFDITLLLIIVQVCCCSKPCDDPLWYKGSKPDVNDLSLEADIVRIRNHKNELQLEKGENGPKLESFQEKWDDLCQIFFRLGTDEDDLLNEDFMKQLKTMPFDADTDKEIQLDFVTWKNMEQKFESGFDLTLTESKSWKFKLYSLIVDGGTRVFRHLFDDKVPPHCLEATLVCHQSVLSFLETRNIITASQHDLLYPSSGLPSSKEFDITLLTVLLRNISGFSPNNPVWSSQHPPSPTDHSPEADIVRIRDHRNKLSHLPNTGGLTKDGFEQSWEDITTVLGRLNSACNEPLPNLKEEIDKLKRETLDPKRETELEGVIQEWIKTDKNSESQIIETVLKHSVSGSAIERSKETVKDVLDDKYFVKTSQFEEAKRKLKKNGIIVLNGGPGEGKTTIAKKLLAEVSRQERYIQLHSYTDWDKLIFDNVDVVLIDDMFGSGVFDKDEYRKWLKHIPSIATAVKNKNLYVVITSRSYILREALEKMYVDSFFSEENTVTLSSKLLSGHEKENILKNHFTNAAARNEQIRQLTACTEHTYIINDIATKLKFEGSDILLSIGFPECARLFSNQVELYKQGVLFFKNPMACVQHYMSSLLDDDDTFVAFFVLWAQKSKTLTSLELEVSIQDTSYNITEPIWKLQFRPEDHIRKIRDILRKHRGGFIHYDFQYETLKFSHRVIQDAVGLVSYEKNTTATIEFCDQSFIENFIRADTDARNENTTDVFPPTYAAMNFEQENRESTENQNAVRQSKAAVLCEEVVTNSQPVKYLSLARYPQLSSRIRTLSLPTDLMENTARKEIRSFRNVNVTQTYMDPSLFKNKIFDNKEFCTAFLDEMGKKKWLKEILTNPTRTLDTDFAEFRFLRKVNTEIRLPVYLIWIKETICPFTEMLFSKSKDLLETKIWQGDLNIALLISIKLNSRSLVETLIEKGAKVDINHVSLAVITGNKELRGLLMGHILEDDKMLLLELCKLGYADVLSKLLKEGISCKHIDAAGVSPIQCAVIGGHVETFKQLLEYDSSQAEMNIKINGIDSSVFHVVVSQQNVSLIDVLLEHGIRPTKEDSNGRTPFLFALCSGKAKIALRMFEISFEDGVHCRPDKRNVTPLYVAIQNYLTKGGGGASRVFFDIAIKLCQYEDNIHLRNSDGDTVMYLACRRGLTEIVNEILKHEDPFKTEGTSILHHFVTSGDVECIDTLLKSNIDPNIHDRHHRTPFMLANALGKRNVIRRLQLDKRIMNYNKEIGIVMSDRYYENIRRPVERLETMYALKPPEHLFSSPRSSTSSVNSINTDDTDFYT